ncbi:neck protein [Synechococcus phage DSL-LC02]|nr:neck protein [Synechococcus phage DSL-LC02]
MAKPSSRQGLIDYCLRRLGAPVLEINVDDDQIDDLVDDALQYFNERHFDGVERVYLKHKITQEEVDRGQGRSINPPVGIITSTGTATVGLSTTFQFEEDGSFIQVPDTIIGVNGIFKLDSSSLSTGMFNVAYQIFLNDVYNFTSIELLQYTMTKQYLETINWIVSPDKAIRFNKRQGKLYVDMNWTSTRVDEYIIIDCYRILNPADFPSIYNDYFIKLYLTALIKKQWGQNLIKFQGVKLPGGVELNGRQIYDDAVRELEEIRQRMSTEFETLPLDMIG